MNSYCRVNCGVERPDWPILPLLVPCGSAHTVAIVGLRSQFGVVVTGCRIRITNVDGVAIAKECVRERGAWVATFPATHFANYGAVKNAVVVYAVGKDESESEREWIVRVGDMKVMRVSSSQTPGSIAPGDIYHKSFVADDGVQHYKKEVVVYSERQREWGAEYVGDYVYVGGEYVPYTTEV